jgi:iron-sulfur cluster repair protein YtfE (RIC family)
MNYKPEIDVLIHEIFEEHEQLRNLFLNIPDSTDLKNDLATIGSVLDAHVRKEERILFPLLQQLCTPIQLQQIHELLH